MGLNDYKLGLKNKKRGQKCQEGQKKGKNKVCSLKVSKTDCPLLGTNQLFKFSSDTGAGTCCKG